MRQGTKVGIIGSGNIGQRLAKKLMARGCNVVFTTDSKQIRLAEGNNIGIEDWLNYCRDLEVLFLAIPTSDDGAAARDYILGALKLNSSIVVVTCEKGAVSNYFSEIESFLSRIGYNATVGGGSMMLDHLVHRINPGVKEVHVILNGTLNYLWDGLAQGRPLGQVVEEAQNLGYAEPGNSDILHK